MVFKFGISIRLFPFQLELQLPARLLRAVHCLFGPSSRSKPASSCEPSTSIRAKLLLPQRPPKEVSAWLAVCSSHKWLPAAGTTRFRSLANSAACQIRKLGKVGEKVAKSGHLLGSLRACLSFLFGDSLCKSKNTFCSAESQSRPRARASLLSTRQAGVLDEKHKARGLLFRPFVFIRRRRTTFIPCRPPMRCDATKFPAQVSAGSGCEHLKWPERARHS